MKNNARILFVFRFSTVKVIDFSLAEFMFSDTLRAVISCITWLLCQTVLKQGITCALNSNYPVALLRAT